MLVYAVCTSVGCVREVNEDSVGAYEISGSRKNLGPMIGLVVADGMGGYQAGEVASEIATSCFKAGLFNIDSSNSDEKHLLDQLNDIFMIANAEIIKAAIKESSYRGMGTTMTVAICSPDKIFIAHVGDSRAYLCTQHGIFQLTRDDSLVNELLEAGTITPEEALNHPQKNIITKALGTEDYFNPQLIISEWNTGDILLLTSDGLTNQLRDEEIFQVLCSDDSLKSRANQLVSLAEASGGFDNISVACCMNDRDVE